MSHGVRGRAARHRIAAWAAAGLAAGALACDGARDRRGEGRPNLVLVVFDTLRADHSSAYGYGHDTTPTLRRLAEEGVRFTHAYAAASTTSPSHATIFTGLDPMEHGVIKNGVALEEHHETLAERLAGLDYQTVAFVSSFVLDARFGLHQGFHHYDDRFSEDSASLLVPDFEGHAVDGAFDRRAHATTRRARRWLEKRRIPERPFFLFVHYFDPHAPYLPVSGLVEHFAPPAPREVLHGRSSERVDRAITHYDSEIAFADRELEFLLDALSRAGLDGDTLVVVTADHGEGLMDHGYMSHGAQIYEESVRVPLLVRWSGRIAPGRSIRAPVAHVDLLPTLLDLLDAPHPSATLRGRSLAPALRGVEMLDNDHPIYLFRRHYESDRVEGVAVRGREHAVREGPWKYIEAVDLGRRELYHLASDPAERLERSERDRAVAERLARRIAAWRDVETASGQAPPPLSPEDAAALGALGYAE